MHVIQPEKRGSIDWPEGMTPRAILPLDATPTHRQKLIRQGIRVSNLTETHLKILRILHPNLGHRFLPKHWILAHFDERNSDNFGHELRDLLRKPNQYIYWPAQQNYSLNSGYKHGVYGLTHKGAEQIGAPLPPRPSKDKDKEEGGGLYAHDLGASFVECSLKFGARDAGFKFAMSSPRRYQLGTTEWEPDCHPIVIDDLFIPGIEFERRAKGGSPQDTDEKLDKILKFKALGIHTELGFKKMLIPIVSTTEGRTQELIEKLAEKASGDCSYVIFKTTPDWARERHFPEPIGEMFTQPWLRVGHPPFSFQT